MENNIGAPDRIVRLAVGGLLVLVGLATLLSVLPYGPLVAGIAIVVGLVFVVTGAMRVCPAYSLVGLDTLGRG